jgi:hypothetical protein
VSLATQARWLEQTFYEFWKQGVSAAMWYLIRDQTGSITTSYSSGVYFSNGTAKPSLQAYRFPFVVMPSGRRATIWGMSPRTGKLAIQHRVGRKWETIASVRAVAGATFVRRIPLSVRGAFRGKIGRNRSLVWQR